MLQHNTVDRIEIRRGNIEPVEIAVEHQRRLDDFLHRDFKNGFQCLHIAVESTDDVYRLRPDIGVAIEDRGGVSVVQGTGATGRHDADHFCIVIPANMELTMFSADKPQCWRGASAKNA